MGEAVLAHQVKERGLDVKVGKLFLIDTRRETCKTSIPPQIVLVLPDTMSVRVCYNALIAFYFGFDHCLLLEPDAR